MKWTKDKPTKEGWYWYKGMFAAHAIVSEVIYESGVGFVSLHGHLLPANHLNGQWAGPIEEPKD